MDTDARNPRASALAERFAAANDKLLRFAEKCPPAAWSAPCGADRRPIGVVAHHTASSYPVIIGWIRTVLSGQRLKAVPPEVIDRYNARHAAIYRGCTPDEVADLIRMNGALAINALRGLSDGEMDASAEIPWLGGSRMTVEKIIENSLVGHLRHHLERMREAAGKRE